MLQLESGEIITGSEDGEMRVWDQYGECIQEIETHSGAVTCLVESGDGRMMSVGVEEKGAIYELVS